MRLLSHEPSQTHGGEWLRTVPKSCRRSLKASPKACGPANKLRLATQRSEGGICWGGGDLQVPPGHIFCLLELSHALRGISEKIIVESKNTAKSFRLHLACKPHVGKKKKKGYKRQSIFIVSVFKVTRMQSNCLWRGEISRQTVIREQWLSKVCYTSC